MESAILFMAASVFTLVLLTAVYRDEKKEEQRIK